MLEMFKNRSSHDGIVAPLQVIIDDLEAHIDRALEKTLLNSAESLRLQNENKVLLDEQFRSKATLDNLKKIIG